MATAFKNKPLQNSQRKKIAFLFALSILCIFWLFSRYPALTQEVHNTERGTLLEREFSPVSKDKMLLSHGVESAFSAVFKASLNWMETNLQGMLFGFLFSAACLLVLEQTQVLLKHMARRGFLGVLTGSLLGMPLGVCTNCATPIGLGMKKAGASNETAFASLISSPSLNPLGLIMLLMLFPREVFFLRLGGILVILFLFTPLVCKLFASGKNVLKLQTNPLLQPTVPLDESWRLSFSFCLKRYGFYLAFILKQVLPIMLIVGVAAGVIVTFIPLENLIFLSHSPYLLMVFAAILGIVMPVPMFVDIIYVWFLFNIGLPLYLSVTLLITMPTASALVFFVMGREVGFRLVSALYLAILVTAVMSGSITYRLYNETLPENFSQYKLNRPFTHQALLPVQNEPNTHNFQNFFTGGVSLVDFDQDGLIDVFVAREGAPVLLKNNGGAHFSDVSNRLSIDKALNTIAGVWGDYDNDGLLDLYVVNYQDEKGNAQRNLLYKNLGAGQFKEVSLEVGLTDKDKSSSAAWADFDNDGDLDLFVSNYGEILQTGETEISGQSQTDRLYRNENGKFRDVSHQAGVSGVSSKSNQLASVLNKLQVGERGFSFQPVWFDFDNDNFIDLFVASDFGSSQLYKNMGNGKFRNVTRESGLYQFGTGMGSVVTDLNQDGHWDLMVTTGETNQVWLNQGNGQFINQASELGLSDNFHIGWGIAEVDVTNSGNKQLILANGVVKDSSLKPHASDLAMKKIFNRNSFYVSDKKRHYVDVAQALGLQNTLPSRGVAVADLNQDGTEDLALTHREKNNLSLYLNNNIKTGHFIKIKLQGKQDVNRFGVGAKVVVIQKGKKQYKQISAGSSFASQNPFILHFGLGNNPLIDKVIVYWPNGHKQELSKVRADQTLSIKYDA